MAETQSVITFTSNRKLYPGDIISLLKSTPILGGMPEWDKFKEQYPEFKDTDLYQLKELGVVFNPECFRATKYALGYTYNYDEATLTGTITTNGELLIRRRWIGRVITLSVLPMMIFY